MRPAFKPDLLERSFFDVAQALMQMPDLITPLFGAWSHFANQRASLLSNCFVSRTLSVGRRDLDGQGLAAIDVFEPDNVIFIQMFAMLDFDEDHVDITRILYPMLCLERDENMRTRANALLFIAACY